MTEALIEPEVASAGVTRGWSADRDEEFARLYERWHPALLAYVRRHFGPRDAEEITQETLTRAYELLDLSRETRRQWGWLIVVARNIAADMGRHRRLCDVTETDLVYAQDDAHDVEQPVLDEECLRVLRTALTDLPQSQSRAWWLTVAEGMTPQTIASSLSCSPVSVRQALFKSRRRLAMALADYCDRVQALSIPAFLAVRRAFGQARRHVGRSAANAGLGATLASTAVVGALAVIVQSMPAQVATPNITAAADSHETAASRGLAPHHAQLLAAPAVSHQHAAPAPVAPVKTSVYVSKSPLGVGTQAKGEIDVNTPIGTVRQKTELSRGSGAGLICKRTLVVECH